MTQELSDTLDNAYRLSVAENGFNNALTREIASLIIRFKGVKAKKVLDEIVRAQNALSRGVSADTTSVPAIPEPPQPDAQLKKPFPQEPKPSPEKSPQATKPPKVENLPPPSFASPVVGANDLLLEYSEIKGMSAMTLADRHPRAILVATLAKIKPSEKPDAYTDRQLAAIILNVFKNADKSKRP